MKQKTTFACLVVHIVLLAVQIVMMINVKYKLKRAERKVETTI